MKKVVEVSGPQIVGAFVGSVCRDVAYADLIAGGAGLEEEHTLPYAVVASLPAGAIVVEHANVKIYDCLPQKIMSCPLMGQGLKKKLVT